MLGNNLWGFGDGAHKTVVSMAGVALNFARKTAIYCAY